MKKRFNKLPEYWKRQAVKRIFGDDSKEYEDILSEVDPWIDVDSLTVKIETREKMRKMLKERKNEGHCLNNQKP